MISALVSRYIPDPLFTYYIAIGCLIGASIYATIIPETLQHEQEESGGLQTLVAPIKPLAVLLPTRDAAGRLSWRLSFLTISVFMTTCGVSCTRTS